MVGVDNLNSFQLCKHRLQSPARIAQWITRKVEMDHKFGGGNSSDICKIRAETNYPHCSKYMDLLFSNHHFPPSDNPNLDLEVPNPNLDW